MDPRKLFERIEQLPALKRMEAEEFIEFLARQGAKLQTPIPNRVDGLQQLLSHPLGIANFQAPSRDEIYLRD